MPKEIGTLTNLVSLRLNNNNFRGLVPKEIASPALSVECDLSGNEFSCPLPKTVTDKRCIQSRECRGIQVGDVDL